MDIAVKNIGIEMFDEAVSKEAKKGVSLSAYIKKVFSFGRKKEKIDWEEFKKKCVNAQRIAQEEGITEADIEDAIRYARSL